MNKMFNQLVKVKTFRKNRAQTELLLQKKSVLDAQAALHAATEELERYIIESTEQEKQLFQKILNKKVKLNKIEEMQHKVAQLRDGVIKREEDKRDTQTALDVAEKRLGEALANYQEAFRIEEKFLMIERIDNEAAFREAERLADLELEEVPTNNDTLQEWEYHNE